MDDDADDTVYFKDALNEIRPTLVCETAYNGKVALEQIEIPPPPDVIFLDLNMPVMDGYECLAALKKSRFKDIPVVIFTTSKSKIDVEKSRQLGATLYFTKPSDFSVLCKKLDKLLHSDLSSLTDYIYN